MARRQNPTSNRLKVDLVLRLSVSNILKRGDITCTPRVTLTSYLLRRKPTPKGCMVCQTPAHSLRTRFTLPCRRGTEGGQSRQGRDQSLRPLQGLDRSQRELHDPPAMIHLPILHPRGLAGTITAGSFLDDAES